ncbi:hypothetical protein NDU88_002826 [Pleurodeles waltl]|uniref:Uncharacterized protein n=1 Tax=Pleurodeles waltl TaxID=8319 RepID=A0AAV7P856_PLEWA|nr:hypothetical protein NDU88_002826 [Pleurodeles waltl]
MIKRHFCFESCLLPAKSLLGLVIGKSLEQGCRDPGYSCASGAGNKVPQGHFREERATTARRKLQPGSGRAEGARGSARGERRCGEEGRRRVRHDKEFRWQKR